MQGQTERGHRPSTDLDPSCVPLIAAVLAQLSRSCRLSCAALVCSFGASTTRVEVLSYAGAIGSSWRRLIDAGGLLRTRERDSRQYRRRWEADECPRRDGQTTGGTRERRPRLPRAASDSADTGDVLWVDDLLVYLLMERDIHIPARILKCRAVSREFQFSSIEMLQVLRLDCQCEG